MHISAPAVSIHQLIHSCGRTEITLRSSMQKWDALPQDSGTGTSICTSLTKNKKEVFLQEPCVFSSHHLFPHRATSLVFLQQLLYCSQEGWGELTTLLMKSPRDIKKIVLIKAAFVSGCCYHCNFSCSNHITHTTAIEHYFYWLG